MFTHVDLDFPSFPNKQYATPLPITCLLFSLAFDPLITNAMDIDSFTECYDIALGYHRSFRDNSRLTLQNVHESPKLN